ncbi:F-type H+-transporting ATPase subunit a [Melghirimyces thermohalophilus]|uniref:ATP synthase subunit a n=1 Tax=Melghirimyces thermohalophilus TaxID=1236220 RepID=A0A1G6MD11_9BACL|nr:F-type H+-transporting ATPase subunit a [Melghirimyces thermohalophilus]
MTPKVQFLGMTFDLTIMIGTTVTCVIVFLITFLATRNRSLYPKGLQNVVEMIIDFAKGIARMAYDQKTAEKYVVFSFTLFLFIMVANQLGIFLMVTTEAHQPFPSLGITESALQESHGINWFKSPTADLNVALGMAIAVALFTHYVGIRSGLKNYLGHYISPMGPIHLIEEFSKPLTHGMRLWANIFAGEILITIMITEGSPLITGAPLIVWMGFSLFIGVIQAYIFTVLANVYISQKMAH